jgi:DNA recombination protein RmuC
MDAASVATARFALTFDALHLVLLLALIGVGFLAFWLQAQGRAERIRLETLAEGLQRDVARLSAEHRDAEQREQTQRQLAEEARNRAAMLEARQEDEEARFATLASGVMQKTTDAFLQTANEQFTRHRDGTQMQLGQLLTPVGETFEAFRKRVDELERTRLQDRSTLQEQIATITAGLQRHSEETGRLVSALSAPRSAGRWGETTLRNVMEHAGLSAFCDFVEQAHDVTDGRAIRPDVIIRLPGGREIVVDSKVSIEDYLRAHEENDPQKRLVHLRAHARNVKAHVARLAAKPYQDQFAERVDFVAMFIPGENFYVAALEHESDLFDYAASRQVVIVTPSTLLALARAVAYGWRQEKAQENARQAADLGAELYRRLSTFGEHIEKMGKAINSAVEHYNKMSRSLNTRVLVTARRFEELSIAPPEKVVEDLTLVETRALLPDRSGELSFEPDSEDTDAAGNRLG